MGHCRACGGVLGRDCFNEQDCLMISRMMEMEQYNNSDSSPEHAKLEAANKVLMEALEKIATCRQGNVVKYIQTVDALALDAIDAADEIMKENG